MMRAATACLALLALAGCQSRPEDRLWAGTQVNGREMLMAVDTCSSRTFLFRPAAQSLGLKFSDPDPNLELPFGSVALGTTEPCDLSFWGATVRLPLAIAKTPSYINFRMDGMIGWPEVRDKRFRIDAVAGTIEPLGELPGDLSGWVKFPVIANTTIFVLVVPRAAGGPGLIFVDTGSMHGVGLSPERWREWRRDHPDEPRTLRVYYTPGAGVVSGEVAWARELALGPLTMTEAPIEEADPITPGIVQGRHEATFGLAALKRLDFIYDGPSHTAYLRARHDPPEPIEHNRFGAVFLPVYLNDQSLAARVVPGTPAYEAGLRTGDVLMTLNGYPAGNWSSTRGVGVPDFVLPERTNVNLTYSRGNQIHRLHARTRDIIGPGSTGYEAGQPLPPDK